MKECKKSANVLRIYPNFTRQVVKNNFTQGLMFPFLESKLGCKNTQKHEDACQRMSLMCELGYQLTYIFHRKKEGISMQCSVGKGFEVWPRGHKTYCISLRNINQLNLLLLNC